MRLNSGRKKLLSCYAPSVSADVKKRQPLQPQLLQPQKRESAAARINWEVRLLLQLRVWLRRSSRVLRM